MKRSRKTLAWKIAVWTVGVIIGLIVVAIIVISTFNWNRARPFVNEKTSEAIGRPFAINGNLTVSWQRDAAHGGWRSLIPWPQFTARDITIGNPAWAKSPQFAHLVALRFEVSPLPLLAHRINVPSVQLVQPKIDLQRDQQSRATWNFTPAHPDQPSAWNVNLGTLGFDRGTIALDDAITQTKLDIVIEPLQGPIPYDQIVQQQSTDAREQAGKTAGAAAKKMLAEHADAKPASTTSASGTQGVEREEIGHASASTTYLIGWTAQGTYKGATANGHGKTGGMLALQNSQQPFPLQADVHLGDSHIALVGTLTDPTHLGALDVRLWFSGSSMAKLYDFTGVTLPDTPPYATEGHLVAELSGSRADHYSYRNFRGHVGSSDLSGNLDYTKGSPRPKLSGTVNARLLKFSDLAPLIGADSAAGKKQRGNATAQPADKILPVEPFRTERWRAMDADVKFSAERIVRDKELPIDALSTHLIMDNGVLQLDPLRFGLAGGTVNSTIRLDGAQSPMQGKLKLGARHLKLKQLFPTFAPMRTSFGEINGDATLNAQGNSVADLLGSANGELKLLMNDGAISKTLLETAGLNVGNIIIGRLFGDKTVAINCAATDMVAKNGLFDVRLFVFDTGDAMINMDGTVNMSTEQLDLQIKPHTKGLRILSLRSPLYVRGTLKNPDVGVQKGPLILRGAGAIALGVLAAPAAALLALVVPNQNDQDENTCRAVLEQMRASGTMPDAAKARAAGQKNAKDKD